MVDDSGNSSFNFVPGVAGLYVPPKRSETQNRDQDEDTNTLLKKLDDTIEASAINSSSSSSSRYKGDKSSDASDHRPSIEDIKQTGGLYYPGPEVPIVAGCELPPPEPSDSISKPYLSMSKHKNRINAIRFTSKGDYAMTCSDGKDMISQHHYHFHHYHRHYYYCYYHYLYHYRYHCHYHY